MKVNKINACDVFDDDNNGFIFGLEESAEDVGYVEWFKTEEDREKEIKINNFEVEND